MSGDVHVRFREHLEGRFLRVTRHRAWHRGDGYRESHCGIPKGLKRVGRETCIREFEVVCE